MYGEDYYERGIETGLSNYQNYRWIPELTIPMAMTIIDFLKIKPNDTVLDYGCSKGYLVKALRMLHRKTWGFDISEYALNSADKDTLPYLLSSFYTIYTTHYDFGIFKDVLEHIPVEKLKPILMNVKIKTLFAVIPLGFKGCYNAPANNRDVTHIICEPKEWWFKLFKDCGWKCDYSSFRVEGIKDSYVNIHPEAHLFMVCKRK